MVLKDRLKIETFVLGPLETNTYMVVDETEGRALLIDPAAEGKALAERIRREGWWLEAILLTHGHADHIGGVEPLRMEANVPVYIHPEDATMLTDPDLNLSVLWGEPLVLHPADGLLSEDRPFPFAHANIHVLHTPGHTQGSVCFLMGEILFSGDTLFRNAVGRVDFPGSSGTQLLASIRRRLMTLPDQTRVYPGHGMETTISHERIANPFLNGKYALF